MRATFDSRGEKPCLFPERGVEETGDIGLGDLWFTGSDIVESAFTHPGLQCADQCKQVLKGVDIEQQRLVVVDLKVLIDDPLQLERIALDLRRLDRMFDLSMRTQQAAAIDFQSLLALHQAELNGKPEE